MTGRAIHVPSNGKAFSACDTEGLHADTSTDRDFATGTRLSKVKSTLIARLALAGHEVCIGRCADYTVSQNGYTYYCQDLTALQAFAVRLGVL